MSGLHFKMLIFSFFLLSCSSNDNRTESSGVGQGSNALSAGAASLNSAGSLSGISTALSSSFALMGGGGSQQSSLDALCTTTGMPWDSDTEAEMQASHSDYSFSFFHCQTSLAGGGPDSAYGAMSIAQMFLCSIESSLPNLQYNGEEIDGGSFTIDQQCLNDSLLQDEEMSEMAGMPLGPNLKITASTMPASSGWDRKIEVTGIHLDVDDPSELMNFTTYFRRDNNLIAFKFVEVNDPLGTPDISAWSFTVDKASQRLHFETFAPRFGRHIRFLAEGSMNNSGVFTSIDKIAGAYAEGDSSSLTKGATIIGSASNNLRGRRFYVNGGFNAENECLLITSGNCSAVEWGFLEFNESQAENFYDVTDLSDFINEEGESFHPLSFTAIDDNKMPLTDSFR